MENAREVAQTVAALVRLMDGMSPVDVERDIVRRLLKSYLREVEGTLSVTRFNEYAQ